MFAKKVFITKHEHQNLANIYLLQLVCTYFSIKFSIDVIRTYMVQKKKKVS